MTDRQQSRRESTAQLQQTTMNQGQEAIEQAIDLQRNAARMALSAMQWQETAQQQGLELTKSLLQGFPGQQFTRSLLESYLQGLEAVAPEMERAMEKGMEAAAQPGTEMGRQLEQAGQQLEHASGGTGTETRQRGPTGGMRSSQGGGQQTGGRTGGQWNGQSAGRTTGQQTGGRQAGGQQTEGHAQQSTQQRYPQTGEWVSDERTYGGEASGTMGRRRPERAIGGGQSDRRSQSPEYDTGSPTGQSGSGYEPRRESGHGGPTQGERTDVETQQGHRSASPTQHSETGDQFGQQGSQPRPSQGEQRMGSQSSHRGNRRIRSQPSRQGANRQRRGSHEQGHQGRDSGQSTQRRQPTQPQRGRQGQHDRQRGHYSQRIDTDHREGDRGQRHQPTAQGREQRGESPTREGDASPPDEFESPDADIDAERDYDTGELPQGDMELSAERSDEETDTDVETDADAETDATAESATLEGDEESE